MKRKPLLFLTIASMLMSLGGSIINHKEIGVHAMSTNVSLNNVTFFDIAAGTDHNLALDSGGNLWAWGRNDFGQVGNGTTENVTKPIQIMRGHKFKKISAGNNISAAIDENGYLYGWGDKHNPTATACLLPTICSNSDKYLDINCGYKSTDVTLLEDTSNLKFGFYDYYYNGKAFNTFQISRDSFVYKYRFYGSFNEKRFDTKIISSDGFCDWYSTNYDDFEKHVFIILNDGTYYYDNSSHGSLKKNSGYDYYTYVQFEGIDLSLLNDLDLKSISMTKNKSAFNGKVNVLSAFFLDSKGDLYIVGYNGDGYNFANSIENPRDYLTPYKVNTNIKFKEVFAGESHILALDNNGKIYSWGNNNYGQVGHGNNINKSAPTKIASLDTTQTFDFVATSGEIFNGSFEQYGAINYSLVVEPTKGELVLNSLDGSFTYTPSSGAYGEDIALLSIDYGGSVVDYQVNIHINRKPFISGCTTSFNVDLGNSYTDRIFAIDNDGDTLTYSIVTYPSKGNLTLDNLTGEYTYQTKLNAAGADSFVIAISDGHYTLNVTIDVHVESRVQVNDEVNIYLDNTNPTSYNGNMNASEMDGDIISYSVIGNPSKGTIHIADDGSYLYTPYEGEYGEDTFTLRATDGKYPKDVTYNVTLYSIKDNSVLSHSIITGTTLDSQILTEARNCTPRYSISTEPSKGHVTINSSTGEYTYIPNPGTNKLDSFTVSVNCGYGSYQITINVYQNTSPDTSLVETSFVTNENTTYYGSVASTDIDTGDFLHYSVVNNPTLGNIAVDSNTGDYIYYPNTDVAGHDNAFLSVTDGINKVLISINIKIESVLNAQDTISKTISQNTSLTDTIVASDKDGDILTYKIKTSAANGVATVDSSSGEYTYVPKNNFYGSDTFTIEVSDGTLPRLVTVNVFVNRKPIAEQISINLIANGATVVSEVKVNDLDGDSLTYSVGQVPQKGSVLLDDVTGSFAYSPNPDAAGNDVFTIIATDGCDDAIITINVHNETELVITNSSTNVVVNQGKSTSGQIEASDADGDTLSYSIKTHPTKGTLSLNNNTGAWTYNSSKSAEGKDNFTVTVTDGNTSEDVTYNLTINIPPVFDTLNQTQIQTEQNESYIGTVVSSDADGDKLTYSILVDGTKGSATIDPNTGRYVYRPNDNAAGDDSFVIGVSDGNFVSELIINVHIESEVSTVSSTQNVVVDKNGVVSGDIDAIDLDGDTLSYSISQQGTKGNASITSDGTWTYFANNSAGDDSFIIAVTDGNTTTYVTVFVHISSTPIVVNTEINVTVGEGGSITDSINAYDEDGDELTYSVLTAPTNGSVSINSVTGEYTYVPNSNTSADSDSFVIAVTDGTTTKYVTVNVRINNSPNCADSEINVNQGGAGGGTIQGQDNENDKLTYTVGSQGSHGTVSINSETGEYTYTTNDKNYFGTDTFTIVISDGYTTTTVVITVNILQNQAPTGSGATVDVDAGSSVSGSVGLTDPEGDTLTYEVTQQGDKGTAYVDPNTGEFTYRANYNTEGYDCFIITVNDGFNTRMYLVEVNIAWVDANNSWAIPTTIALGSVTALSLGGAGTLLTLFLKKRKMKK